MSYANPAENKPSKKITVKSLREIKAGGEKFAVLALYDAPMANIAQQAGVEVVLVGDSLGMTVLGFDSTIPVTMEHMLYHVEAVRRGNQVSLIIGDMPFMTYATVNDALVNATKLMQAGAHMVKLEGGRWLCETVSRLSGSGIPVCAHLGLTPQSVNKLGGYRVQGRDEYEAQTIFEDAKLLQQAGADLLVLECVPSSLASKITHALTVPAVGIGAGPDTDAQVLVINDMIGLTPRLPKFAKNFLLQAEDIADAVSLYVKEVKTGAFPGVEHSFADQTHSGHKGSGGH